MRAWTEDEARQVCNLLDSISLEECEFCAYEGRKTKIETPEITFCKDKGVWTPVFYLNGCSQCGVGEVTDFEFKEAKA